MEAASPLTSAWVAGLTELVQIRLNSLLSYMLREPLRESVMIAFLFVL